MKLLWLVFCFHGALIASTTEELLVKRVYNHLFINDTKSACEEAKIAFNRYPNSPALFEAYLKALARHGDERMLWRVWNEQKANFPEVLTKRDLLEDIAWGIIENASVSSAPPIRIAALLGAFFGQDARGVKILCKNMRDQNSIIRMAAIKLAGHLKDANLCDEIFRIFQQEKNWQVRLEAISAIGKMNIREAEPMLIKMIGDDDTMAEEKIAAIEAWIQMNENANREEISKLAGSNRAGLRLLASEVIGNLFLDRDKDIAFQLTSDHHAEVRASALHTLGYLRVKEINNHPLQDSIHLHLNDKDPHVAITAAWLITLLDPELGQKAFLKHLEDPLQSTRLLASAALAATGRYGLPLMQKVFPKSDDLYVRMNLAIGLIQQRVESEQACVALYAGLMGNTERWEWEEEAGFKVLGPSKARHNDSLEEGPEALNQITRLELLNLLAIMKYPQTENAVRAFLKEKKWGIAGMASALLLTEGDESALEVVEKLLGDSNPKVRVQAALILALWGGGENSVAALQKAYESSDREIREKILEGLGRVGLPSSIPFLVEKMQEPYQSLRIIAAAALLECLYN